MEKNYIDGYRRDLVELGAIELALNGYRSIPSYSPEIRNAYLKTYMEIGAEKCKKFNFINSTALNTIAPKLSKQEIIEDISKKHDTTTEEAKDYLKNEFSNYSGDYLCFMLLNDYCLWVDHTTPEEMENSFIELLNSSDKYIICRDLFDNVEIYRTKNNRVICRFNEI